MIGPATIVYDGSCTMCSRCVALLLRHDTANLLGATAGGAQTLARHGTSAQDAMYVIAGDRRYRGYWAFQAAFERLPGLRAIAPVMGWRPVAAAGVRAYEWIARHRGVLRWIVPALGFALRLAQTGEPRVRHAPRSDRTGG